MMKGMKINTIFNLLTKVWSLISIYIFVPFYIKFLGTEAYGVVSFFSTMQAGLNILGLGFSNTLRREFAISETGNSKEIGLRKYKLLRSIEFIYWIIAFVISVICLLSSRFISGKWLNIGELNPNTVAMTIFLMGTSIGIQLVANLYSGALFGLNKQVEANIFCVAWSALKQVGCLILVWKFSTDLRLFYFWHILSDIAYVLVLRINLAVKLKKEGKCKFSFKTDFVVLKEIWKYAFGLLLVALVSFVNRQFDKIIVSKYFSLTELGAYNLTSTLGGLVAIFAMALYTSVFPTFTEYVDKSEKDKLHGEFLRINRISTIFTVSVGAFVSAFAIPLISVWTQESSYGVILSSVAPLIVFAYMITELQEIPYALALANGNTRINAIIGVVFLPIVVLGMWGGAKFFGLLGLSIAYAVVMTIQTIIYLIVVIKKFVTKNLFKFIFKDTLLPLLISYGLAFISKYLLSFAKLSDLTTVILAILLGIITLIILFLLFDFPLVKAFCIRLKGLLKKPKEVAVISNTSCDKTTESEELTINNQLNEINANKQEDISNEQK